MNNRKYSGILAIAAMFTIGLAAAGIELLVWYPARPGNGAGALHEVKIEPGTGPQGLANALAENGVIQHPKWFAWWVRISGQLPNIQAGRYRVADNLTPQQIIHALKGPGMDKGVRITVPEGFTLRQIADVLAKSDIVTESAFLTAATDQSWLHSQGIPGATAEGFLFPDTYYLEPGTSEKEIIKLMHDHFTNQMESLGPPQAQKLISVVTLASIVQAEARIIDEMPTIAGVYTNRLNKTVFPSGLLQADPTVSYGCEPVVTPRPPSCGSYRGVLTRSQLDDQQNPYNTYRHPGLPPGPICAPGANALKAALNPAKVPYLFFVAGKGGRHVFSTTLKEHNAAVRQYRQNR